MRVKLVKKQKMDGKPNFTLVVPLRNRWGPRVRNCMRSIQLQTLKRIELIVSDYGSTTENHEKLMRTLEKFNCTVYYCPTKEVWSMSISRNLGIRRAKGTYIATTDVDCILQPNVVSNILDLHKQHPRCFIASLLCSIPKMNLEEIGLPRDYDNLSRLCKYQRSGYGGLMSAPRDWWFKVRGFDERMKGWGAEDDDIWRRAINDGMKTLTLERLKIPGTRVFHQWHPNSVEAHKKNLGETEYTRLYNTNVRILRSDKSIIRNDETWGAAF